MAELLQFPAPAAIAPTEASDGEARLLALDIRRSWIVEAPAGSGKTSLLVERYLKLLAEAEIDRPESVLAITFTRKATAELRERMLRLLAEASRGETLPPGAKVYDQRLRETALTVLERDRRRDWRLLERPGALNIRTIDGLCAEITQSLPLLASGGRRQPVDDPGPLFELAAERTLRQLGGPDRPLHEALRTVLLHRDVKLGDVRALLAGMLQEREQWGELLPLAAEQLTDEYLDTRVRPQLEATLDRVICAGLCRAGNSMPRLLFEELNRFAAEHASVPGYQDGISPIHMCHGRHSPPGETAAELDHWRALIGLLLTKDGEWRKSGGLTVKNVGFEVKGRPKLRLTDLLADFSSHRDADRIRERLAEVRCLPPARYPEDQWQVCRALCYLLRHALVELEVLFDERGECDFAAISLAARAALRSSGGAADLSRAAGYGLAHLLVDELQDTSAAQFELFELLTKHFDGFSNTVFLVGDPKQSIYLFRQARVERFLRTASSGLLGSVPLGSLRLRRNFRSQGALVEDFNSTFRQLLPSLEEAAENPGSGVPFVAAEAERTALPGISAVWHTAIHGEHPLALTGEDAAEPRPAPDAGTADRRELVSEHRLREAVLARQLVEDFAAHWPTHPSNPEHRAPRMAILCRNRSHATAITAELRCDRRPEGGTPPVAFRAVNLEPLQDRPEVLDALALTRALLHPADRVAWLALLRAPWCGLKLADLLVLTGDGPGADDAVPVTVLVEERAAQLSEDGQRRLAMVWPVLARAATLAGKTALPSLVERTWLSLGGGHFLRPDQRENVHAYLRLLRRLETGGAAPSLTVLEKRLQKLYAAPQPEGDLEITTIHNAKGREWDLVILPALERQSRSNTSDLLQWMELERDAGDGSTSIAGAEIILSPIAPKGRERYPLSRWLSGLENQREAAERTRLFYVACTRAREELHLIAAASRTSRGELQPGEANSLLRSAWPYAHRMFDEAAPQAAATTTPVDEIDFEAEPLALAAGAEIPQTPRTVLQRTPDGFDALEPLRRSRQRTLPWSRVAQPGQRASAERPAGGFGVRAFGNVVHRFLHHLANQLALGHAADDLLAALPGWQPRLAASLRGEGLPPAIAEREAIRVREALVATLSDPAGRWILSPHPQAVSERPLVNAAGFTVRADRVFLAAAEGTGAESAEPCLWIIDFKTTDPGGRPAAELEAGLRQQYGSQLAAYAAVYGASGSIHPQPPVRVGLYLPLAPLLITWPAAQKANEVAKEEASQTSSDRVGGAHADGRTLRAFQAGTPRRDGDPHADE